MRWKAQELTEKFFRRGLEKFNKPVFLVQASNDETTEPAKLAREILSTKSAPYQVEIYPFTGNSGKQISSLAISGWQSWGYDVMVFLEKNSIRLQPAGQTRLISGVSSPDKAVQGRR